MKTFIFIAISVMVIFVASLLSSQVEVMENPMPIPGPTVVPNVTD